MCSVCSQDTQASKNDVSREACAILNVLAATPGSEKRLTVIQLIDRWRSSKVEFLIQIWGHKKYSDLSQENHQLLCHLSTSMDASQLQEAQEKDCLNIRRGIY